MQLKLRYRLCLREDLRRSCVLQIKLRLCMCLRDPLRRSHVSEARNAGEIALPAVLARASAEIEHKMPVKLPYQLCLRNPLRTTCVSKARNAGKVAFWRKGVWNLGFRPRFGGKASDHILEERVWNSGFRSHCGGKGSETQVSDHILEERRLKRRFQTTFWRKGAWPHFGGKALSCRLFETVGLYCKPAGEPGWSLSVGRVNYPQRNKATPSLHMSIQLLTSPKQFLSIVTPSHCISLLICSLCLFSYLLASSCIFVNTSTSTILHLQTLRAHFLLSSLSGHPSSSFAIWTVFRCF